MPEIKDISRIELAVSKQAVCGGRFLNGTDRFLYRVFHVQPGVCVIAELGELNQSDLDISINRIRKRAGMPLLELTGSEIDPVLSAQYPYVQETVILEIRRERRVELAMEGFRYDDLMRWKAGPLLAETFRGMYFPSLGARDLDMDGKTDVAPVKTQIPQSERKPGVTYIIIGEDLSLSEETRGNIVVQPNISKVFDEKKHYLFPLPRTELLLNKNLTQNPGWAGQ